MNNKSTLLAAPALLLAAAFAQSCTDDSPLTSYVTLQQTRFTSDVLADIRRADGSPIPDLVQAIQDQYGFRAQVMNFVVPSVTVALQSWITETDPAAFDAVAQVTGWETFAPTVINDAQSLTLDLQFNGAPETSCIYSPAPDECSAYRDHFTAYLALYSRLIRSELQQRLMLKFLGVDAQGGQKVLTLSPSQIEYDCVADLSKVIDDPALSTYGNGYAYTWNQDGAAQCAGQVLFAIDAPSARMAPATQEDLDGASRAIQITSTR